MTFLADPNLDRLLPVLMHVETHLDDDLSLETMAARAGLSPSRFHRLFRAVVGETPKQYTLRLRLERGAIRLLLERTSVLDVALGLGFNNHETFTRAFRRRFGIGPRAYRSAGSPGDHPPDRAARTRSSLADAAPAAEVSATTMREMDEIPIAFIRHVGPYESVPVEPWDRLAAWARRQDVTGPSVLLGIARDAPGITPAAKLRFDAAIRIPAASIDDAAPGGEVGTCTLAAGTFACTEHAGPFETLPRAYRATAEHVKGLRRYRLVGLPAVEIYHATRVNPEHALNRTDVCLPVERR